MVDCIVHQQTNTASIYMVHEITAFFWTDSF